MGGVDQKLRATAEIRQGGLVDVDPHVVIEGREDFLEVDRSDIRPYPLRFQRERGPFRLSFLPGQNQVDGFRPGGYLWTGSDADPEGNRGFEKQ